MPKNADLLNFERFIPYYKTPNLNKSVLIKAITKAEKTPNTMTDPASLNILPPTPRTNPSVRCSMAAEITEFPNPVTGTALPAPEN